MQGSEAVEDCVQGALSSLYPPFESTAPPLLSQVFSVLESTYQHDSLRYLLDYFIPAKNLLHRLQQHACSQYLGCLFLHSGWPLCLGEKVVVQLSTLDWRLLHSTDFYLQVVPFSTRCPRLALKCLAPGGRNVQEVLVPESQHPLVFTAEWLHCINKERGCKREGAGGLDTCLVSTCDGVVRLPWAEVVYPKFIHNPTDDLGPLGTPASDLPGDLSPTGGGLGWGSSSGELDSWSWDEEDDLPPDGDEVESGLPHQRRRSSEERLSTEGAGDYVELLEPRGGPDGGTDTKQRYLEMHGICKTKTLPLCRRSKAIRIRRGKAWGVGRSDGGSRVGFLVRRDSNHMGREPGAPARRDWGNSRPPPRVIDLGRERRSYPSSLQDSDEGNRASLDTQGLYLEGPAKERRPGVGKERDGAGCTLPWEESQRGKGSESRQSSGGKEADDLAHHKGEHAEGQSDQGSHQDKVFSDADRLLADSSSSSDHAATPMDNTANAKIPLADISGSEDNAASQLAVGSETRSKSLTDSSVKKNESNSCVNGHNGAEAYTEDSKEYRKPEKTLPKSGTENPVEERHAGKQEERVCPRGKEVKTGGFRAPRRKRKVKGGKGKGKSGGRLTQRVKGDHPTSKSPSKTSQSGTTSSATLQLPVIQDNQLEPKQQVSGANKECAVANDREAKDKPKKLSGEKELQSDIPAETECQRSMSIPEKLPEEALPVATTGQSDGQTAETPPLLRDLDQELLQSGKLMLTGTVDRLGRGLVVTEAHVSEEGYRVDEMARVLSCYYRITRPAAREKGLTVIVDSRQTPPSELCLSALRLFKTQCPVGLGSVLILTEEQQELSQPSLDGIEVHTVRGTGVLQQFVDRQQLTPEMGGDFDHSHSDWLVFRLSLEQLTERCESALSLIGHALQSMETEPLPDCIKNVTLSVDKHRQLMTSVLADQRLTELQQRGGAWLAGLTNGASRLAHKSPDCRAALASTSNLYDSVDDALHSLVRVSNQRGRDLDALGRLASLVDKLDKCEREIEHVQEQLEDYKDPPLSLSRLSLKQQKFKSFRESAMELHSETLSVLGEIESWAELEWAGLAAVLKRLPPVREKVRDMSHCLSDCWTQLDNTQRLLSTLTEASQWCDVVSSSSPSSPSSPLSSLPPIPPSRFQDARALALELGGGALLDLWSQTLERYQRTLAQFKSRILQAERGSGGAQNQEAGAGPQRAARGSSSTSSWELEGGDDGEWGAVVEGALQSWGSLASLFRPQNCSTLKIGEEKKKEGGGPGGGGKFLQNLLNPAKKSPAEVPQPSKPVRKRNPSFDLQALLAPRRSPATPRPVEAPVGVSSRTSPLSWLGRKTDPVLTASVVPAVPGWREAGGGVLIRGVEVSSKEVVDHTGLSRQHVLLSRAEREMGGDRPGTTAQSKLYLQWCRLVSSERQYVAVLKGVEESYMPLLESPDAPSALRGKTEAIFSNWSSLSNFHSQFLLPAMEGALSQTLQQQDCFSKYKDQFLQYSHYIRTRPELDSLLVSQASDFFKLKFPAFPPLSALSFPHCLSAPPQRLEQYREALEEMSGLNFASDSALSILRHAQRHGEDLRASDLIVGCPVPVAERGDLVRQGELLVCGGGRRRKTGMRTVFLYQHHVIFTKVKTPSPGRTVYSFKHSIKTGEMGLTQSVGEEGLRFEVWVRQASRTRDCLTLQAQSGEEKAIWTHDIAQLLWTHAINNTELCLKESLCMGVSSKLLLDVTGAQTSELDSSFSLNDRVQSSCSDSSSVGSQKEGGSPSSGRDSSRSAVHTGHTQSSSPSTAV
ncbi:rho guanine nucleotide exchange factor 40 [Chanos chanos]|uniref:Rho guanine nucleotide exchange factor 40 n=1 Tax=Chanos chanos TaxID=29144 RepID=A0A6J2VZY4_CHACN|nr:rho guanine nucleotide exchange factor 40-like [Chanos chanos]